VSNFRSSKVPSYATTLPRPVYESSFWTSKEVHEKSLDRIVEQRPSWEIANSGLPPKQRAAACQQRNRFTLLARTTCVPGLPLAVLDPTVGTELSMGPFSVTRSNPPRPRQLTDPTQHTTTNNGAYSLVVTYFIHKTSRFPVPVTSAVKLNLTAWRNQIFYNRTLNALTY